MKLNESAFTPDVPAFLSVVIRAPDSHVYMVRFARADFVLLCEGQEIPMEVIIGFVRDRDELVATMVSAFAELYHKLQNQQAPQNG